MINLSLPQLLLLHVARRQQEEHWWLMAARQRWPRQMALFNSRARTVQSSAAQWALMVLFVMRRAIQPLVPMINLSLPQLLLLHVARRQQEEHWWLMAARQRWPRQMALFNSRARTVQSSAAQWALMVLFVMRRAIQLLVPMVNLSLPQLLLLHV